jgi:mono/diheme cytochrome c family protein
MKITQLNVRRLALVACGAIFFSMPTTRGTAGVDGIVLEKGAVAPSKTGDPARGELLFRSICGGYCHATGPGSREAPFLFDCDWELGGTDSEIFTTISAGVSGTRMIAFGGKLPEGDSDIWSLVAYLRSESRCSKLP